MPPRGGRAGAAGALVSWALANGLTARRLAAAMSAIDNLLIFMYSCGLLFWLFVITRILQLTFYRRLKEQMVTSFRQAFCVFQAKTDEIRA
jgi:hypothetical protein